MSFKNCKVGMHFWQDGEKNLREFSGISKNTPIFTKKNTSWWFQPIWKIWVKMGSSFPNFRGEKFQKNMWVATHHPRKNCPLGTTWHHRDANLSFSPRLRCSKRRVSSRKTRRRGAWKVAPKVPFNQSKSLVCRWWVNVDGAHPPRFPPKVRWIDSGCKGGHDSNQMGSGYCSHRWFFQVV